MPKKQKLKRVSWKEAVRAFEKAGWVHSRTTASHYILKKEGERNLVSIPAHGGDVGIGLLDRQVKNAGLTVEEFNAYLDE